MSENLIFEVSTPLHFIVRVSKDYWDMIVGQKHPVMRNRETDVQEALRNPDEIRRSRSDKNVYLFYKKEKGKRWICAIAKRLNGEGFLITTYPTDAIKEGEIIWTK
ncbi:MAG: DUF4258 domain-containing protein [candidate division KSB1 bacterium]|nr:DUF4258 domain-containing protein [candidate division KSB1 bacterium]